MVVEQYAESFGGNFLTLTCTILKDKTACVSARIEEAVTNKMENMSLIATKPL